jgi:predicted DsbA family dithiol-disulfide isomerase
VEVTWRAFPLRPNLPLEGVLMKQVAQERGFDLEAMESRFQKIAGDAGLEFASNPKVCNSRRAHELSVWATENHSGSAFHRAVFRANYVEGKDISNLGVLADIAAGIGLSREDAKKAILSGAYRNRVDQDWELSRQMDIMAAPTFVIRPMKLVGAQPYEKMEQFVLQNGGQRRNL